MYLSFCENVGNHLVAKSALIVFIFFVNTENLLVGKLTLQSSTYSSYSPNLAVDGNTKGVFSAHTCTHSKYQVAPWFAVDMASEQTVATAKFYNRKDCCQGTQCKLSIY